MYRNVVKILEESENKSIIHPRYDYSLGQVEQLIEYASNHRGQASYSFKLFQCAFRAGYIQGCKATKAELKKRGAFRLF